MESEISEVLKILRHPLLSDPVLEFVVSEDGYKKSLRREKRPTESEVQLFCFMTLDTNGRNNVRYWVSYDGQSRTAIICFPTSLHEEAGELVINSMVNEVVRMLQNAGVGDDVTSRIRSGGHATVTNSSSKRSYKEPDGLIIFDDGISDNANRIVLEVGFSQTYSSLKRECLWWIEQREAPVVVSLCLTEKHKSSGATPQIFRTVEERDAQKQRYIGAFNTTETGASSLGATRTYRETDSGVVKSEPVYLVKDGVDVSDGILRDLSTIKVCDFVAYDWLNEDVLRSSAVNFLRPQSFMQMMSNAIFRTALNRVDDKFELDEH